MEKFFVKSKKGAVKKATSSLNLLLRASAKVNALMVSLKTNQNAGHYLINAPSIKFHNIYYSLVDAIFNKIYAYKLINSKTCSKSQIAIDHFKGKYGSQDFLLQTQGND